MPFRLTWVSGRDGPGSEDIETARLTTTRYLELFENGCQGVGLYDDSGRKMTVVELIECFRLEMRAGAGGNRVTLPRKRPG